MLKVMYDRERQTIGIILDVPVPPELLDHPELSVVLAAFSRAGGETRHSDDQALTELHIQASGWPSFVASIPSPEAAFHGLPLLDLLTAGQSVRDHGLQVNFHQKPFDSPRRYWNFILDQGHFAGYLFNRLGWFAAPVNRVVTSFPLHVDIETASTCNMNCPMCYRRMLKDTGQMDPALFRRIVDECAAEKVFSVRLSWRGEALTHPRIKELIAYACERIPNVSFLTNAFYIDEAMARCFVECGVSYVAVSFDGIGATYEKVRAPASFAENRARLRQLRHLREKAGANRPQVRLCTIWPAIKDDPQAYYEAMQPVSDFIVYNPYINFAGPMTVKPEFICQYPWERLVVAFNGDTQCCTGWNAQDIVLGNATDQSLKSMWQGPAMDRLREIHAAGGRLALPGCAACRHGSKGDENASIDDILARRW